MRSDYQEGQSSLTRTHGAPSPQVGADIRWPRRRTGSSLCVHRRPVLGLESFHPRSQLSAVLKHPRVRSAVASVSSLSKQNVFAAAHSWQSSREALKSVLANASSAETYDRAHSISFLKQSSNTVSPLSDLME